MLRLTAALAYLAAWCDAFNALVHLLRGVLSCRRRPYFRMNPNPRKNEAEITWMMNMLAKRVPRTHLWPLRIGRNIERKITSVG